MVHGCLAQDPALALRPPGCLRALAEALVPSGGEDVLGGSEGRARAPGSRIPLDLSLSDENVEVGSGEQGSRRGGRLFS